MRYFLRKQKLKFQTGVQHFLGFAHLQNARWSQDSHWPTIWPNSISKYGILRGGHPVVPSRLIPLWLTSSHAFFKYAASCVPTSVMWMGQRWHWGIPPTNADQGTWKRVKNKQLTSMTGWSHCDDRPKPWSAKCSLSLLGAVKLNVAVAVAVPCNSSLIPHLLRLVTKFLLFVSSTTVDHYIAPTCFTYTFEAVTCSGTLIYHHNL